MGSFENKVVLVTGASSGIGAATAILFGKKGANVVMVGRNEAKLSNVVDAFTKNKLKQPLVIKADISKDNEVCKLVTQTVEKFGRIDVLVNNAGFAVYGNILDGNMMKSYDEVMAVNVRAQIYITSLVSPYLIKTKGCIINISSVAGQCTPFMSTLIAYHVSKAALDQFSRAAAKELAPHGVRVNTVSPGPVKTDFIENTKASFTVDTIKTPLNRVSESEEIAELIIFLASDNAIGITGSNYVTDNGCLLLS